jgi:transposase
LKLIHQHTELAQTLALITSIKGITNASAIQILAELMILPPDMTVKQWVAYAGLDPRQFESGSSVAKKSGQQVHPPSIIYARTGRNPL